VAWLVHLYTASGAVLALAAAAAAFEHDYRTAFLWLYAATVVDATDGVLARAARVSERTPWFDGALLDNIVDYLTFVFVPVLIVWRALLVPDEWAMAVCALVLLSSAYGFSRREAKTADGFFTGFPSYWNIVVLYMYAAGWPPETNTVILCGLAVLVFVPIRYVYPSQTEALRPLTIGLGVLWAVAVAVIAWRGPAAAAWLIWASLAYPAYYLVLSLVLFARRSRPGTPV